MKRSLVQILVVVANIQMRTLKTEVGKGSMWTGIGHGWVDPKFYVKAIGEGAWAPGTKGNPFKITEPAVGCERWRERVWRRWRKNWGEISFLHDCSDCAWKQVNWRSGWCVGRAGAFVPVWESCDGPWKSGWVGCLCSWSYW